MNMQQREPLTEPHADPLFELAWTLSVLDEEQLYHLALRHIHLLDESYRKLQMGDLLQIYRNAIKTVREQHDNH